MADEPLGESLAAALTHEQPLSPVEWAISLAIEEWDVEDRLSRRAMLVSGYTLADALASLLRADPETIFQSLGHMPDAMLEHLKSPQGWTLLAGYVAADLGRSAPAYTPTVH